MDKSLSPRRAPEAKFLISLFIVIVAFFFRSFLLKEKNQKFKAYTPAATNGGIPLKSRKTRALRSNTEISLRSMPPFALRRFR